MSYLSCSIGHYRKLPARVTKWKIPYIITTWERRRNWSTMLTGRHPRAVTTKTTTTKTSTQIWTIDMVSPETRAISCHRRWNACFSNNRMLLKHRAFLPRDRRINTATTSPITITISVWCDAVYITRSTDTFKLSVPD